MIGLSLLPPLCVSRWKNWRNNKYKIATISTASIGFRARCIQRRRVTEALTSVAISSAGRDPVYWHRSMRMMLFRCSKEKLHTYSGGQWRHVMIETRPAVCEEKTEMWYFARALTRVWDRMQKTLQLILHLSSVNIDIFGVFVAAEGSEYCHLVCSYCSSVVALLSNVHWMIVNCLLVYWTLLLLCLYTFYIIIIIIMFPKSVEINA